MPSAPRATHRESLGGYITRYPSVLEPEFCAQLIAAFEASDRRTQARLAGTEGGRVDARYRKCERLRLEETDDPTWAGILDTLTDSLIAAVEAYQADYPSLRWIPALELCDLTVLKYGSDDYYHLHCDGIGPATCPRIISAIWYLNDVLEGGETEFPYQKVTVRPRQGSLILFPSGWLHPHRAVPPRSGPKYGVVGWCEVRDQDGAGVGGRTSVDGV